MSDKDSPGRALLMSLLMRLVRPIEPRASQVVYVVLFALALIIGAHQLWRRHAERILKRESYTLAADRIELTRVPPWIHGDIAARVVRDGSLAGVSLARPDLTVRVADAFAMHPWVSKVNRIKKKYGRVVVDLAYRRPVAMVQVTEKNGQPGLYPVDEKGILLPTEDFTSDQACTEYLQVELADADAFPPDPTAGSSWGDKRVRGAAKLASALLDRWRDFGLVRIVVIERHRANGSKAPPVYRLMASNGATVLWGSAPTEEVSGEPTPGQKIAQLQKKLEQYGELPPRQTIDLRSILVAPGR